MSDHTNLRVLAPSERYTRNEEWFHEALVLFVEPDIQHLLFRSTLAFPFNTCFSVQAFPARVILDIVFAHMWAANATVRLTAPLVKPSYLAFNYQHAFLIVLLLPCPTRCCG